MITYRLRIWAIQAGAVLVALCALTIVYSLVLNFRTFDILGGFNTSPLSTGITAISVTAPVFAIMDALLTWLKHWRENRIHGELIQVIEAVSTSPEGMDLYAIKKTCPLPILVVRERVHELILMGRMGVRMTDQDRREFFLIAAK